jgi:hypothetical protein
MATIVDKETITNADISADLITLTYLEPPTDLGGRPRLILPRVELGMTNPIAGGGTYKISAQIDGGNVTPVSSIAVPVDQTTSILQGRHLAVEPNDVVTITIRGLPADTSVSITTALFDATPIHQEDLDKVLEEIADQIQNVNIVAVNERIVLGPCANGTIPVEQLCLPQPKQTVTTPQQAPRTVRESPQVIPQIPLAGE